MRISIFGGAQTSQEDAHYQQAFQFSRKLAKDGHTILNGGYMGLMEAVSRGAAEEGGHVIGITCEQIERWRPIQKNVWIKEEWRAATLLERIWLLLANCDLAVALPGGIGTLAEISVLWNCQVIKILPSYPILLIGKEWQNVFEELFTNQGAFISIPDRHHLIYMRDLVSAYNFIHNYCYSN